LELILSTESPAPLSVAPADRPSRLQIARLILAVVLTPAALIYSWGRVLVLGMFVGRPESLYVFELVAGLVVVMLLTAGLSARLNSPWIDRLVTAGIPALWVGACAAMIWLHVGDLVPKLVVGSLFISATLWVVWAAWMFYRPWSWLVRLGVLTVLIPFAIVLPLAMRVDGLTGEASVNFAWRTTPIADPGADLPTTIVARSSGPETDLTPTPDDYPQFLGPQRTGVIAESTLSPDWTSAPPREKWRKAIGAGWGSFAVVREFAITQEQRGGDECVVCYRISDGNIAWLHSDQARFDAPMGGPGPRATPTITDGRVYTVGGTGILNCLDGATGRPHWSANILDDNSGRPISHGVCGSPLVAGDAVIVAPTGNKQVCLAAYDQESGKRLWQGGAHVASYGSPALVDLAGSKQVLLVTDDGIEGCDLATGHSLWSFTWTNGVRVNCSQPIVVDAPAGRVLFCTGYNTGSVLLEISSPAGNTCAVKALWKNSQSMKTKFTTAVLHKGYAYGLDEGILACLDPATGKQKWKAGRYQHGQILLAGDLLIVQTERGDVVLVQPDPLKLIELGTIPALSSKTWNNPALAGRILLVRNDQEAACYELPTRRG
jgi:outer membrane protein assembly factor BamB